jgi:hypothetical protein
MAGINQVKRRHRSPIILSSSDDDSDSKWGKTCTRINQEMSSLTRLGAKIKPSSSHNRFASMQQERDKEESEGSSYEKKQPKDERLEHVIKATHGHQQRGQHKIPDIPMLSHSLGKSTLNILRERIKTDEVLESRTEKFLVIFRLTSIEPAQYVRAIQELEMLKTRIAKYEWQSCKVVTLPSFVEVWNTNHDLREAILTNHDPEEAKWQLANRFKYRLATNFMPMYARCIFEHFNAHKVLDGCAGWGDRMAGALSASTVTRYVGFDPNSLLVPGYETIQNDFGFEVTSRNEKSTEFTSNFKIHTELFEDAGQYLGGELFDFAFTGPPFFEFEDYGSHMPRYVNWIEQFYKPLFQITHDHLEANCFFAVYLNDTISGSIEFFMMDEVPKITTFKFVGKLGIVGGSSHKIRDIFIFQRGP